jgi:hypothetical protein
MISFVLGFIAGVAAYLAYDYFTSKPEKVAEVKEEVAKVEAEVKKDV